MSTYKIIANADDFGRHKLINEAVEKALENGILRSATIMPTGEAFEDAIALAKRHPELGLGVHLTMVNAKPELDPKDIPSLVTPEGVFVDNYMIFVKNFFSGKVNLKELKAELTAQMNKVAATGVKLDHIDSHQHMHTLPGVIDIALDLAKEHGIDKVRIPKTPFFTGFSGNPIQLAGRAGLYTMAALAEQKAKKANFKRPEHFAGIVAGEAVSEEQMLHMLENLKPGTTEIMVHPGTNDALLQKDCLWEHGFEAELNALTSPAVQKIIKDKNIQVTNFQSL